MPLALKSVSIQTIHRWQHCMYQWMASYQNGLATQDAQLKVKQFSLKLKIYKSHQHVPESLAKIFDELDAQLPFMELSNTQNRKVANLLKFNFFYSVSFYPIKNPSRGFVPIIKRSIFLRGIRIWQIFPASKFFVTK